MCVGHVSSPHPCRGDAERDFHPVRSLCFAVHLCRDRTFGPWRLAGEIRGPGRSECIAGSDVKSWLLWATLRVKKDCVGQERHPRLLKKKVSRIGCPQLVLRLCVCAYSSHPRRVVLKGSAALTFQVKMDDLTIRVRSLRRPVPETNDRSLLGARKEKPQLLCLPLSLTAQAQDSQHKLAFSNRLLGFAESGKKRSKDVSRKLKCVHGIRGMALTSTNPSRVGTVEAMAHKMLSSRERSKNTVCFVQHKKR